MKKIVLIIVSIIISEYSFSQNQTKYFEGLIDIGYGTKLFVKHRGTSSKLPVIIFESCAGGGTNDWDKVKSFLPNDIQTLSYDRVGTGKSSKGILPRTMTQEVFELNKLLKVLKIKEPIILVGQSIGGLTARIYAQKYPKQVKGMVLLDPTHENAVLGSMRYGGWTRLREKAVGKEIPKPTLKPTNALRVDSTADYMAEEFQLIYIKNQNKPKELGGKPLVIIGSGIRKQPPGTPDEQWKILREERDRQVKELTKLSSNSKFITDIKSGHYIQFDNPELVANEIVKMINLLYGTIVAHP